MFYNDIPKPSTDYNCMHDAIYGKSIKIKYYAESGELWVIYFSFINWL